VQLMPKAKVKSAAKVPAMRSLCFVDDMVIRDSLDAPARLYTPIRTSKSEIRTSSLQNGIAQTGRLRSSNLVQEYCLQAPVVVKNCSRRRFPA
jgi:hypothetical protein